MNNPCWPALVQLIRDEGFDFSQERGMCEPVLLALRNANRTEDVYRLMEQDIDFEDIGIDLITT